MKIILSYPQMKLHNEIRNTAQNCKTKCATCCTIKFIGKLTFICFGFAKQTKIKFYILNRLFKLLEDRFHYLGKHKLLYQKCNIIIMQ